MTSKDKRGPSQALKDGKRGPSPPLRTAKVGRRVLVDYENVLQFLGIDPASEPDRPKTISVQKTIALTSLSPATVNRMIAAGRDAAASQENAAA
jgi:hypothetical protein